MRIAEGSARFERRLASREDLECYPGGCCGTQMSEGQFVWNVIHERNFLRSVWAAQPLLPKAELDQLDQEILNTPSLQHLHKVVRAHIARQQSDADAGLKSFRLTSLWPAGTL